MVPLDQTMHDLFLRLTKALEQKNTAQIEIDRVSEAIRGLAYTCEDPNKTTAFMEMLAEAGTRVGFASAIRSVLALHKKGLTAKQVRDAIQNGEIMDLSAYSNPLASIHTTLRRLVEQGEAAPFGTGTGETSYRLSDPAIERIERRSMAKKFLRDLK
jgi:hypothetical protein